jgi:hypothetical protein
MEQNTLVYFLRTDGCHIDSGASTSHLSVFCSLFNDAFSVTQTIQCQTKG